MARSWDLEPGTIERMSLEMAEASSVGMEVEKYKRLTVEQKQRYFPAEQRQAPTPPSSSPSPNHEQNNWVYGGVGSAGFGTILCVGLFGIFLEDRIPAGIGLTVIGAIGLLAMAVLLKGHRLGVLYGMLAAIVVTWAFFGYDVYLYAVAPTKVAGFTQAQVDQKIGAALKSKIPEPQPRLAAPPQSGFSEQFLNHLAFDFLRLPRPCLLKIVAPAERSLERQQLAGIATNAQIASIPNANGPSVAQCLVIDATKDQTPLLYGPHEFPATGIAIHTSERNIATREFLAAVFRSQGISVVGDSLLPANIPENVTYIEFGHRLYP